MAILDALVYYWLYLVREENEAAGLGQAASLKRERLHETVTPGVDAHHPPALTGRPNALASQGLLRWMSVNTGTGTI